MIRRPEDSPGQDAGAASPQHGAGILALMGSGETAPTMVTLHRRLITDLGPRPDAVGLETSYGFQENVDGVSSKARAYFSRSVGMDIRFPHGLRDIASGDAAIDRGLAEISRADWVFAGPGSPSYAMRHWSGTRLAALLRTRFAPGGGVTVFASAAACTAGRMTFPVYEIYKAGHPPRWLPGLDLLTYLGSPVVIPHYDNAEGGTYDTRYCYLGERRLRKLEEMLPGRTPILGIDEHTALIVDFDRDVAEVHGRGAVTLRVAGDSRALPGRMGIGEFRALVRGERAALPAREEAVVPAPKARPGLTEAIRACEWRFGDALSAGDPEGMTEALLDAERTLSEWGTDTDVEETEQARGVYRGMLIRFGELAAESMRWHGAEACAGPLLTVRQRLRAAGNYADADLIRDVLGALGFWVRDTREGSRWGRL